MGKLISYVEAADYIGIMVGTLHRYVEDGLIPYYNIAGKKMFTRADLDEFIESRRVTPARSKIARMPAQGGGHDADKAS